MKINGYRGEKDNQRFPERCFKLLEYLRRNTDQKNKTSQKELRETEIGGCLVNSETFNRRIRQLAMALNFEESEVKPDDEWMLVYKVFAEYCGENGGFYDDDNGSKCQDPSGEYISTIFLPSRLPLSGGFFGVLCVIVFLWGSKKSALFF